MNTNALMTMYTCPMHPEVISDKPGNCPKCGMEPAGADGNTSMSCCSNHSAGDQSTGEEEKRPKSFVGRFLYDMGKKDFDQNKRKKSCC